MAERRRPTLRLASWSRAERQLAYDARIGGLRFATSFWWQGLDLTELEARYGREWMERIYFHLIAFDLNRLVSLAPGRVDFGPLASHATPRFVELWRDVLGGVWAQWRYENDRPGDPGPRVEASAGPEPAPAVIEPGAVRRLAFCGGGKDSLVALGLLEAVDEAYDAFAYAHSVYGEPSAQLRLIDDLLDRLSPRRRHRAWVFDDFLTSPVVELEPRFGVRTLAAAETPASLFLALPVALAHGLTDLVLAHERSADRGNLVWEATGEEINHQWGKSLAAERRLAGYVRRHLVANLSYYSLLKPVADPVVFGALVRHGEAVDATHSCNVAKPWCGRCAKCAYVGLGYAAFLPGERVEATVGGDLFDRPECVVHFRRLLGLGDHLPFECVGQAEETRLLFELARRRGAAGAAVELYRRAFPRPPSPEQVEALFRVDGENHQMPPRIASRVLPALAERADEARRRAGALFAASAGR